MKLLKKLVQQSADAEHWFARVFLEIKRVAVSAQIRGGSAGPSSLSFPECCDGIVSFGFFKSPNSLRKLSWRSAFAWQLEFWPGRVVDYESSAAAHQFYFQIAEGVEPAKNITINWFSP